MMLNGICFPLLYDGFPHARLELLFPGQLQLHYIEFMSKT